MSEKLFVFVFAVEDVVFKQMGENVISKIFKK